jgi:hypothetical protein
MLDLIQPHSNKDKHILTEGGMNEPYIVAVVASEGACNAETCVSTGCAREARKHRLALHVALCISALLPVIPTQHQIRFLQKNLILSIHKKNRQLS